MPYLHYDPSQSGDRQRATRNAFLGLLVVAFPIMAIIYYIISLIFLFNSTFWENYLFSLGLLFGISFPNFFAYYAKIIPGTKWEAAKKFYLFFVGGLLDLTAIISIIFCIYSFCSNNDSTVFLIISILTLLITTTLVLLLYRKLEGHAFKSISLFAPKELTSEIQNEITSIRSKKLCATLCGGKHIECNICEKSIPNDSIFCPYCGKLLTKTYPKR